MSISTPVIAIHGGAGTIARSAHSEVESYHREMNAILKSAQALLTGGGSALDAVAEAVRLLEDCPLFNAGKGAVYTRAGTHELDAAIMDGANLKAGAVANVTCVRNPVLAARAVMEHSEHVLLVGRGADVFARQQGMAMVDPGYYQTQERHQQWLRVHQQSGMMLDHDAATFVFEEVFEKPAAPIDADSKFGTVGAVALDRHGNMAAATSTGGITNKMPGRVGDSPLIGAGCYAANATAAVSATGTGEIFIRTVAAYDVAARMAYTGATLQQAMEQVVMQVLPAYGGRGGLIAVDAKGNVVLSFNTEGMYRGYARGGEAPVTAIHKE